MIPHCQISLSASFLPSFYWGPLSFSSPAQTGCFTPQEHRLLGRNKEFESKSLKSHWKPFLLWQVLRPFCNRDAQIMPGASNANTGQTCQTTGAQGKGYDTNYPYRFMLLTLMLLYPARNQQMKVKRKQIKILLRTKEKTFFSPFSHFCWRVCINPQGRKDLKLKPEPHFHKCVQCMCYRYSKKEGLLGIRVKQCCFSRNSSLKCI